MRQNDEGATTTTSIARPHAQLKLVHSEIDRELSDNSVRQSNALTRASFLLASSGIFTLVTAQSTPVGWDVVFMALNIVAVGCGLCAVWLWPSKAFQMTADRRQMYITRADEYDVEFAFTENKLEELDTARMDLKRKNYFVLVGFIFLVTSWLASVITGILRASGIL